MEDIIDIIEMAIPKITIKKEVIGLCTKLSDVLYEFDVNPEFVDLDSLFKELSEYKGRGRRHIKNAVELSKSNLIPKSDYKRMLTEAPNYIINKMLREINITI